MLFCTAKNILILILMKRKFNSLVFTRFQLHTDTTAAVRYGPRPCSTARSRQAHMNDTRIRIGLALALRNGVT